MQKLSLSAEKRTILGRKVKQLRKQRLIPGNVFGKNSQSLSVQIPLPEFEKVYQKAGETGLIDLHVDGDIRTVLIKNVQIHPVSDLPIHVDFHQVDLKEKIRAKVPLEVSGQAPAVTEKLGILLNLLDEIEIEALPINLPEKVNVDVSDLKHLGDTVRVKDLKLASNVTVLTPVDVDLVKIGDLVTKEAEKEVKAEEAAAVTAATSVPTATAEAPAVKPLTTPAAATTTKPEAEKK